MVRTVQKSYRKNILREMKSSISRVVSLFGIVALGVMMLTGLMCIAPDMRTIRTWKDTGQGTSRPRWRGCISCLPTRRPIRRRI